MINELYVPVFTAYITGLTEPFLVGSPVHFQRGHFHYFWPKKKIANHVKQCLNIISIT